MLKLELKLNAPLIAQQAKYTPEAIQRALDKTFAKYHFRKENEPDGTVCYYGNGNPQDYGMFGQIIVQLKDKQWFVPYLTKWLWYNGDDGADETDFAVEDVLFHYTHRESA